MKEPCTEAEHKIRKNRKLSMTMSLCNIYSPKKRQKQNDEHWVCEPKKKQTFHIIAPIK